MSKYSLIVGLDAGGTKSHAVVGDERQFRSGKVAEHDFGPGNFREIGFEGVVTLAAQIRDYFQIQRPSQTQVIAGFAGAGTPESQAEVSAAFEKAGFSTEATTITSDANLMLASIKNNGVVLIAGTGGICIGRKDGLDIKSQKGLVRAGGYGYRVGSEVSAYYLGRRAIDVALRLEDGLTQEPTILYEIVKQELGLADLRTIPAVMYPIPGSGVSVQALIANLAPRVLQSADVGDKVAQGIVSEAVSEMADHIRAVCAKLDVASTVVALHGGPFKASQSETLLIGPLRQHPQLSKLNLSFRTLGVDLDAVVEAVRFVLDNESS